MILARSLALAGIAAVTFAAALAPGDANAQQIYRIVEPDGRITFSDKPPMDPARAKAAPVVPIAPGEPGSLASLPFDVRQAAARYPVTLYSAPVCTTCAAGRALLVQRGIPFAERSVTTNDDFEALKRLSGTNTLPLVTIGGQQIRGFSESEWTQFLDAAGYPKTSQLPANYVPSPATPLVAVEQVRPPASPASAARQATAPGGAPAPAEPVIDTDNPTGIKF